LTIIVDRAKSNIQNSSMFGDKELDNEKAKSTSFLYFYLNPEINAYLNSLELLKPELSFLFSIRDTTDKTLNVFDNSNFLIAYYHMTQCRLLLVSAISSLERYYQLGNASEELVKRTADLLGTTKDIRNRLDSIRTVVKETNDIIITPFKPYYSEPAATRANTDMHDKISGAANAVLRDSRKNWWWRALVGGLVGGLITGLIIK
jgi:hypothetical protein